MTETWDVEGFIGSLTGSSPHTRKAYESDLRQFVAWAERGAQPLRRLSTTSCSGATWPT